MISVIDFTDGNICPNGSGVGSVGTFSQSWASGIFSQKIIFDNYQLRDAAGILALRNKLDNGYMPIRAQEFQGNPYGVGVTGNLVRFRDIGAITFSSATVANGTADTSISRKSPGIVQIGSGTSNGMNGTLAVNNILLQCSDNASLGFYITIDSSGTLAFNGPITL